MFFGNSVLSILQSIETLTISLQDLWNLVCTDLQIINMWWLRAGILKTEIKFIFIPVCIEYLTFCYKNM